MNLPEGESTSEGVYPFMYEPLTASTASTGMDTDEESESSEDNLP